MAIQSKPARPKTCINEECRASFVPQRLGQKVCSPACGLATKDVNADKARKALADVGRKALRADRERVKRKSDHMHDCQQAFNAWVRARDAGKPCISCGTTANVQYAAGHYRTVASCPELRFEPLNVHLQCNRNCNMGKSGSIVEYRIELVKRIGAELVEWLEGPHEPKRYTIEDLKAITAEYRAKTRELKRTAA